MKKVPQYSKNIEDLQSFCVPFPMTFPSSGNYCTFQTGGFKNKHLTKTSVLQSSPYSPLSLTSYPHVWLLVLNVLLAWCTLLQTPGSSVLILLIVSVLVHFQMFCAPLAWLIISKVALALFSVLVYLKFLCKKLSLKI